MDENVAGLYSHFDNSTDVTEYERYRYFTKNDPRIVRMREQMLRIVAQRQLTSMMNDTKWLELQEAVSTLPFPPAYIEKLLTDDDAAYEDKTFEKEPTYFGDWAPFYNEGMPLFFSIEWMKIRPRYSKYRGRLIPNEIIDETAELVTILKRLSIPFEEDNGTFMIWGYR